MKPLPSDERHELFPGIVALPHGLLLMEATRTLIVADAHLAYEDVIGGALPLWSTSEAVELLTRAIRTTGARELVMLGDVVHASVMSEGAARAVSAALASLRGRAELVLVAGNHEGRSRGRRILGPTVESVEREGWLLVHGDEPGLDERQIVGHLHPTLPLARGESVPVFLAAPTAIVVPALTPYSLGLNVLGDDCARAMLGFRAKSHDINVVASTPSRVYPFGRLSALRQALRYGSGNVTENRRGRLRQDP
jgi:metallophosphoesterase superfamily enzyme